MINNYGFNVPIFELGLSFRNYGFSLYFPLYIDIHKGQKGSVRFINKFLDTFPKLKTKLLFGHYDKKKKEVSEAAV